MRLLSQISHYIYKYIGYLDTMHTNAISVLRFALKGPVDVIDLIEKVGIHPWQIYSHIRSLRQKDFVILEGRFIRLRNDWKARLLNEAAKDADITKILYESNEEIISFLTEPITIKEIVQRSGHSRATVYRAIADFNAIGIIRKVFRGYVLIDEKPAVVNFAKWLESERKEQEALR